MKTSWLLFMLNVFSGTTLDLIWTSEVMFLLISQYTMLSSALPGHKNWMEVVGVIGGSSELPMWLTDGFWVTFLEGGGE